MPVKKATHNGYAVTLYLHHEIADSLKVIAYGERTSLSRLINRALGDWLVRRGAIEQTRCAPVEQSCCEGVAKYK